MGREIPIEIIPYPQGKGIERAEKARLIGYATTVIRRSSIGSVSLKAGLLFADIIIETNGGQVTVANGFTRSDAKQIQQLLSK